MRLYELIIIYDSSLDDSTLQSETEKIQNRITGSGGKIHKLDRWGNRRLAYEIRKHNQGYYVFFLFEAEPGLVSEMERGLRLNENALRYLTVISPGEAVPAPRKKLAGGDEEEGETEQMQD